MVARTLIHGRLGISATNSTVRVSLSSGWSSDSFVCRACRQNLQRRNASAATALAEPTPAPLDQRCPPVIESTAPHRTFEIKAGVVLSRPPLITRDLTPFEREYFFYQRRLNERLVLPFTRYFYYPKDTPGEIRWKRKMKERQIAGRDLAGYNPYKEDGWNDELLVGDPASDPQGQLETVLNDALADQQEQGAEEANGDQQAPTSSAEKRRIEEQVVERPYPRSTEADEKKDFRSLNRALSRTLYLLVKEEQGPWQFPYTGLQAKEDLLRVSPTCFDKIQALNESSRPQSGYWFRLVAST